jgi:hypothetical protein
MRNPPHQIDIIGDCQTASHPSKGKKYEAFSTLSSTELPR